MTITVTRSFLMADRYHFDFGECSASKGFAQLDSEQDASYYGAWISPTERKIVSYCEGDVTVVACETDEELVQALRERDAWQKQRIDPGFNPALKQKFIDLGVGDLLH